MKLQTFFIFKILICFTFFTFNIKLAFSQNSQSLDSSLVHQIFRKPIYFGASMTAQTMARSWLHKQVVEKILLSETSEALANLGENPVHLAFEKIFNRDTDGSQRQLQHFIHTPSMPGFFPFYFDFDFIMDSSILFCYLNSIDSRQCEFMLSSKSSQLKNRKFEDLLKVEFEALNFAYPLSSFSASRAGYQIHQLISEDGELHLFYQEATLLGAVDLFYWIGMRGPAPGYSDSDCGIENIDSSKKTFYTTTKIPDSSGEIETKTQRVYLNVHRIIPELISTAFLDKKVLILGTVPKEKEEFVNINQFFTFNLFGETLIKEEVVSFPEDNYKCVNTINNLLKRECTPEKACYLVDLHRMVDDLQRGVSLDIRGNPAYQTGNLGYSYSDYRGIDGVHLTHKGAEMISNVIEDLLTENPPLFL